MSDAPESNNSETTTTTEALAPTTAPVSEPAAPETLLTPAQPDAPETPGADPYDPEKLTLPEGASRDDPHFSKFTDLAKQAAETGFTGPVAQALLDLHNEGISALLKSQEEAWSKHQEELQAQARADPEIGGDKLKGVQDTIKKVMNDPRYALPGLPQVLAQIGNNVTAVKFFYRICKDLTEGQAIQGNPTESVARDPTSLAELFYGMNGSRN